MVEYVYRPVRRVGGKRVRARLYSGRYSLGRGQPVLTVALHTPDEQVARKRLRDLVIEQQREAEGLIAPKSIRGAASSLLIELLADYAHDLHGRELTRRYVHDTLTRLERIAVEAQWDRLSDIRPDSFVMWRSTFKGSAKTRKEYQTSLNAFLNWLVRVDRLAANPLAKIDRIDTRGKQVRPYRAFSEDELRRLFAAVSRERRVAYLTLLYTGQRRGEIAALVVDDLTFGEAPFVRIRIETTKDKDKRAVPLHPLLADELRRFLPEDASPADPVFPNFPTYDALLADLHRARIERRDALGRALHFHSFRKTWQTMGVRAGISQRVAQDILGHSDPALTANVYTDLPAIGTQDEIAKLPWIFDAQLRTQKASKTGLFAQFRQRLGELVVLAKVVAPQAEEAISTPTFEESRWLPGLDSNQD